MLVLQGTELEIKPLKYLIQVTDKRNNVTYQGVPEYFNKISKMDNCILVEYYIIKFEDYKIIEYGGILL